MSDLIMPLVDEKDPFLREVPHRFDFDSPHEDPDKFEERLIENMIHYKGIGLSANQIGIPVTAFAMITDGDPMVVFNPEIVEWSADPQYANTMDYTRIISFLVEAVKEQQKKINLLTEKLNKLDI